MVDSARPATDTGIDARPAAGAILLAGVVFGRDPVSFRLVARDFGPPVLEMEDGRAGGSTPVDTDARLGAVLLALAGL